MAMQSIQQGTWHLEYLRLLPDGAPIHSGIVRLYHIGHVFLDFSFILLNPELKICDKVMQLNNTLLHPNSASNRNNTLSLHT